MFEKIDSSVHPQAMNGMAERDQNGWPREPLRPQLANQCVRRRRTESEIGRILWVCLLAVWLCYLGSIIVEVIVS